MREGHIKKWKNNLEFGIYPLFRENPKLSVEYLSALIVFVAFLHIVILYTSTDNCKKILAPWIFFAFIVFLMVPLSALANRIMFFDILFAIILTAFVQPAFLNPIILIILTSGTVFLRPVCLLNPKGN